MLKNIKAGGYILGDEGSGSVLGKQFLSDLLKGLAPEILEEAFYNKFRITPVEAMDYVYNRPFPNRFLGTIAYFLSDYLDNDYAYELWSNNLRDFFRRSICQYDYQNYPIRFIGSLAYAHPRLLKDVAREFGAEVDLVEETSMNGLIRFHSDNHL